MCALIGALGAVYPGDLTFVSMALSVGLVVPTAATRLHLSQTRFDRWGLEMESRPSRCA